ncbi:hypothetical protein [Ralstonia phage vB_RsoP_BMB50]|uniref:I-spanin n=1 Tax=Ralstonia phage vB_RsoP_BMB50 TaxID=2834269 RepID=A0A8E5NVG5_9CAUD|nr:hypothetical protein [Ralstonia phage vB_RsoP_BMB50]
MALFDKIALGLICALVAALGVLGVLHKGQAARLDAAEASLRAVTAAQVAADTAYRNQAGRLKELEAKAKERAHERDKALDAHPDWSNAPVPADIAGRVR